MLVGGGVKQNVYFARLAEQRWQIADIAQDEASIRMCEVSLFEEHELAFVIVESNQRGDFKISNELADELLSDGPARTGHHNSFATQTIMSPF